MTSKKHTKKDTTIAVSGKNYKRLQKVKHKLEEANGSYSFNDTVGYLLDKEEKNG